MAFLTNHIGQIVAADFFVVPTVTYRLVFVLVLLAHDRRRIRHVAVTAHPTAAWTAQQLREAFPLDEAPRYLIHDRDHAPDHLGTTAQAMGIEEVLTAPHAPWQNAFVERFVDRLVASVSIIRSCSTKRAAEADDALLFGKGRALTWRSTRTRRSASRHASRCWRHRGDLKSGASTIRTARGLSAVTATGSMMRMSAPTDCRDRFCWNNKRPLSTLHSRSRRPDILTSSLPSPRATTTRRHHHYQQSQRIDGVGGLAGTCRFTGQFDLLVATRFKGDAATGIGAMSLAPFSARRRITRHLSPVSAP